MQSENSSMTSGGAASRGHQRRPSLGKAMPVTSLLLNFPPLHRSAYYTRHERSPDHELPPLYFPISDTDTSPSEPTSATAASLQLPEKQANVPTVPKSKDATKSTKNHEQQKVEEQEDTTSAEEEFEFIVSECSSSNDDDGSDIDGDPCISLIGNSTFYTPCLTCTNNAPDDLATRPSAINEMCRRLCTDECRLRLSLAGFEPPSTVALEARAALTEHVGSTVTELDGATPPPVLLSSRPLPSIAIQRKKFLRELLTPSDSDNDSNFVDDDERSESKAKNSEIQQAVRAIVEHNDDGNNDGHAITTIDPHEIALLKELRERFEIAEALAKTSAMTSTSQIKQRLAARKLEIELESQSKSGNASPTLMTTTAAAAATERVACQPSTHLSAGGEYGAASSSIMSKAQTVTADGGLNANCDTDAQTTMTRADFVATGKQGGNDYEPPRDLLLYLVRMGSFNSAPKINNIDSQDDGLEIPQGLNSNELLQHVKNLRGEHFPPLLSRYFLKPLSSVSSTLANNDITDNLRCLQLNFVSRVCSAPISPSPNHLRLLQWNILSQSLGQNNDGFVRCPEEALTWENRKFLIVQEILQNDPDIVCLQEVDHFKFLQNILGSQNYEGIFFPKPDSPCLYIEENNGPDGCAIFFKRDKFELKSFDTRILEVWRVQSNQVAIAANLYVKGLDKEICVCTTHLKARHGSLLSKLRNEQGRDLMRFVNNFAGEGRPILLCGDFNAEPTEPVYATILSCNKLKLSSAYADIKMANAGEACQDVNEMGEGAENVEMVDNGDENDVKKSIQNEPAYTTWKIREDGEECHTIDYVFYAKEHFKVLNCLEFPHGDEIGKNRTPSFQYPSDHFSLVCDFEIMATSPKQQQHNAAAHKEDDKLKVQ